ncbi:MAG: ribose-5-phosphate isomerase [Chloroflexi bacterium]|nr:ribose-5-phosphate isomerase [Chloroflexota bacterium]
MRVALGADHGGFELKRLVADWVREAGHQPEDLGAYSRDPQDDYPDFALAVADALAQGQADRGIILCGSGVGASVAANKVPGVRAAICHDTYSARQGVEHDDLNVLCLGSRVVGPELARELVLTFLSARFSGEERHRRRLAKVRAREERMRAHPPGR